MKAAGLPISDARPGRLAALRALGARARALASGNHALALADQAVVSGMNFVTTVVIARTTTPGELGAYAIALSIIASFIAVQESLLLLPYSIRRHRPTGTLTEHAGSVLALTGAMSAIAAVVLAVVALGLTASGADRQLTGMTWVLTGVLPFALIREFGRRFAFAHLHVGRALVLDGAVAALQMSALAWLAWRGQMSAFAACGALGAAYGLTGIVWLYLARDRFTIAVRQLPTTMRQSWELGKWLMAGKLTTQVQTYITYWLSITMLGAAVTGVYAACMSIVAFANPLVFGLGNILTPRSVLAWKNSGGSGLRHQAIRDAMLYGAILAPFCVVVFVAGESLMHLLYPGGEFAGKGNIVGVLSLSVLATALGMPASNALASMERPRAIVVAGSIGMIVSVVLVWVFMVEWGLGGAAIGVLSGNVIGATARWVAFLALVPKSADPAPALRAMRELTGQDTGDWVIKRLGEGDHAVVYGVTAKDGGLVWQAYTRLVVKQFKPEANLNAAMVTKQHEALLRLHAALDGRICDGWRIATPKPLCVTETQLALVMSMVPGHDMSASAANAGTLEIEVIEAAARATTGALHEAWSRGQVHGDFGLQNILFGFESKMLSFIDPGTPESCSICNAANPRRNPAALDLAHFVYDLATDVSDLIGSPTARLRRQVFAEAALRSVLATIASDDQRRALLREVHVSAYAHMAANLHPSWSMRGLWHGIVKQIAVHRIDALLDRLETECDGVGDRAHEASNADRQPGRKPVRSHPARASISIEG